MRLENVLYSSLDIKLCLILLSFQIYILFYSCTNTHMELFCLKVDSPKAQVDRKWKYVKVYQHANHFSLIVETAQMNIDSGVEF